MNIIKTRRFNKLQELIQAEDYFSEESIRMREPLLYFLYVGQYKRNGHLPSNQFQMSTFMIEQAMKNDYEILLQKIYEQLGQQHDYPDLLSEENISQEDLEDNEDMLIRLMHDKFLCGLDDFNYKDVDENEKYDNIKEMQIEQEEQYFENEDDQETDQEEQENTEYTGIQDY